MLEVVQEFASLMDRNRYQAAARFLDSKCRYRIGAEVFVGPRAIAASYSANYESARKKLDEIIFLSEVTELAPDLFKIHYTDRIRKGSHWHEHRCEQTVRVNDDKIVEICHGDLPGEVEALSAFYAQVGLSQ